MSEQINIIACPPTDKAVLQRVGILHFVRCADAEEIKCEQCGQSCLIGPRQREVRAKTGAQALCYACVAQYMHKYGVDKDAIVSLGGDGHRIETNKNN